MKFVEPRPCANPDAAARKLMELANAFEPVQDGMQIAQTYESFSDAKQRSK